MKALQTLHWLGGVDGHLRLIDQTRLPVELVEIDCRDVEAVWEAIKTLRVRGAPAIGVAAAYGVCLGVQSAIGGDEATFFRRLAGNGRPSGHQPAHGGQPLLGLGADEASRRAASRPARPRKSPPPCWPRPGRSTRKTGRCAGRSAATGPNCSATGRAC